MRVRVSRILILISLIPLLFSDGMQQLSGMPSLALTLIRAAETAIYLVFFVDRLLKRRGNWCINVLVLIYLTVFISAAIHGTFFNALNNYVGGFAACMVFDYWLNRKYEDFLNILNIFLILLVLLNLLTIIIFPGGMYQTELYDANWLLGYKNMHFGYIMAALATVTIQSYRKKRRFTTLTILFLILSCISLYIVDSVMSFVACLIYTVFAVFVINYNNHKAAKAILNFLSVRKIIIATLILSGILLFFQSSAFFNNGITSILSALGRDATVSGRLPIWAAAIRFIQESPIIGYGIIDPKEFVRASGIGGGTHAHNYILNILVMGGFICLLEHVYLYYKTTRHMSRNRGFLSYALTFIIGLYFFTGVTNINFMIVLFNPMFLLAYYALKGKPQDRQLNRIQSVAESRKG